MEILSKFGFVLDAILKPSKMPPRCDFHAKITILEPGSWDGFYRKIDQNLLIFGTWPLESPREPPRASGEPRRGPRGSDFSLKLAPWDLKFGFILAPWDSAFPFLLASCLPRIGLQTSLRSETWTWVIAEGITHKWDPRMQGILFPNGPS